MSFFDEFNNEQSGASFGAVGSPRRRGDSSSNQSQKRLSATNSSSHNSEMSWPSDGTWPEATFIMGSVTALETTGSVIVDEGTEDTGRLEFVNVSASLLVNVTVAFTDTAGDAVTARLKLALRPRGFFPWLDTDSKEKLTFGICCSAAERSTTPTVTGVTTPMLCSVPFCLHFGTYPLNAADDNLGLTLACLFRRDNTAA